MTKKELHKRVGELRETIGELRYKADQVGGLKETIQDLETKLSRMEGVEDANIGNLNGQVRELQLRLDVLTMTPEQIKVIRSVDRPTRRDHSIISERLG